MNQANLGRWIAERREALGLSQLRLAVAIGKDPSSVSRWERGLLKPGIDDLGNVCRVFGVPVADAYAAAAEGPVEAQQ